MKDIPDREQIPRLYEGGLSTVKIAKMVGLTVGAVGSILKARGVKLRTPKEAFKLQHPNGTKGANHPRWKGGRRIANQAGYISIYSPDHPRKTKAGYVMEHILVAEKTLGRYLEPGEVVHHINHIKTDNRPENLQVVTRSEHVQNHFDTGREVYKLREEVKRLQDLLAQHGIGY